MLTKLEKKQMKIFFTVLVITTFIMGFTLKYAYGLKDKSLLSNLVLTQMLMPAFSVIMAQLLSEKRENIMYKFNIMFVIFTVISYIMCLVGVSQILGKRFTMINVLVIGILLIALYVLYIKEGRDKRKSLGLTFNNMKKSWLIILLFVFLYVLNLFLSGAVYKVFNIIPTETLSQNGISNVFIVVGIILLIPLFVINIPYFFGEEYGWRYFLQPKMQKIFGKRLGVIILGFIWGIWHIFISIYYYSPDTFVPQIVAQIAFTVVLAVFMGYAYMKTDNLWVPIIIHYINNNFAAILTGGNLDNRVFHWNEVIIGVVMGIIVYGLFIFAKVYGKDDSKDDLLAE